MATFIDITIKVPSLIKAGKGIAKFLVFSRVGIEYRQYQPLTFYLVYLYQKGRNRMIDASGYCKVLCDTYISFNVIK